MRPRPQTAKPPWIAPVAQASHVIIPLSIPADREKVIVALDGQRLESALNQRAVPRGVIRSLLALRGCQSQLLAVSPHFPVDLRTDHPLP